MGLFFVCRIIILNFVGSILLPSKFRIMANRERKTSLYGRLCSVERKCDLILLRLDELKRLVRGKTIDGLIDMMRREALNLRRMAEVERKRTERNVI